MKGFKRISRLSKWVGFAIFYLKELILANLQLAHDILTPDPKARPGVIAVPLDLRRDISLLLVSHLLSMTPGTLSLDISNDRKALFLHVLYLEDDPDESREAIQRNFVARIRDLLEYE